MSDESAIDDGDRRHFLETTVMAGGLIASYGTFAAMAARYLHASNDGELGWQILGAVAEIPAGQSFTYVTPAGAKVVVARQGNGASETDFIALSSICPHLGCKVHWEAQHDRFFCPCHNGAFDANGQATAGPPAAAKQQLTRFPLKIENNLLFIQVPLRSILNDGAPLLAQAGARGDSPEAAREARA